MINIPHFVGEDLKNMSPCGPITTTLHGHEIIHEI